jgi:dienelactone hydrolase
VPPWDDELTVGEPMPVNPAPVPTAANPERFLTIRTSADAQALRRRLNTFLWGRPALPVALPASVMEDVPDRRFTDMAGLARIDALSIALDFGLSSYVYHFLPTAPNGEVIVYHEGHGDDFSRSKRQIAAFIAEGYAVVGVNMPLAGRAPHPQITDQDTGARISIDTHDQFGLLAPERGHPIRYFVEPTIIAINHLGRRHRYQRISAVGISGGGWTTVLAAAVDTRIAASFPVAGALPRYLQTTLARDQGDWEQTLPELYAVANYLDLFVLGAAGSGRQQLQIFNAFDPCCFAGERWRSYGGALKARVAGLASGSLDIWSDSTHREHTLSGASVRRILAALDN